MLVNHDGTLDVEDIHEDDNDLPCDCCCCRGDCDNDHIQFDDEDDVY